MKRDAHLGAGVQSGLARKERLNNVEGKLSKPLDEQTSRQGPRGAKPAGGSEKFRWK